jgi:hypothetical protein
MGPDRRTPEPASANRSGRAGRAAADAASAAGLASPRRGVELGGPPGSGPRAGAQWVESGTADSEPAGGAPARERFGGLIQVGRARLRPEAYLPSRRCSGHPARDHRLRTKRARVCVRTGGRGAGGGGGYYMIRDDGSGRNQRNDGVDFRPSGQTAVKPTHEPAAVAAMRPPPTHPHTFTSRRPSPPSLLIATKPHDCQRRPHQTGDGSPTLSTTAPPKPCRGKAQAGRLGQRGGGWRRR